ncbi:MAG: inorganic phosphate transporter, PiT family [Verrucomicrobiota bacterium]|jgi:PiT family inorganic phosphate transporter
MTAALLFVFLVIVVALVFELVNGFHDAANSIATVVATKVLTAGQGIVLAAIFELIGALIGTAVAKTIAVGLVVPHFITMSTILCGLIGGIIWNLLTWWLGLPSSSSHALMGGLCGAALAAANSNWAVIIWSQAPAAGEHWYKGAGLLYKVIIPMMLSPIVGFILAFSIMGVLLWTLRALRPHLVNIVFGKAQIGAAAGMALSHGMNDAQKTMGILALTLFIATGSGTFNNLPQSLQFLHTPKFEVATWVKIICALTMACGTAMGGRRIIKTLGGKMVKMQPIHGFAAQTTAATVITVASVYGMPISTTHTITTAIMGVGATKRLSAVKWSVVGKIVTAWVLTLPISGALAYFLMELLKACGAK